MEFKELKMIGDWQNHKPRRAMAEAVLHPVIRRTSRHWNRRRCRCFGGEVTVMVVVVCGGLILAGAGVLSFEDLAWAALGTLPWVEIAALMAAAVAKRRKRLGLPSAT